MAYHPFTHSTQEYTYSNLDVSSISDDFLSNMISEYSYVFPFLDDNRTYTHLVSRTTSNHVNATSDFDWLHDLNPANFEYNPLPEFDLGVQPSGHQLYVPGFEVNNLTNHSSPLSPTSPPFALYGSGSSPAPSHASSSFSPSPASTQASSWTSTSSSTGSTTPTVNNLDMVTCEWDNCGQLFPRSNLDTHFILFHPGALSSQSNEALPCLWGTCTSRGTRLGRHLRSHIVLHPCAACGDTFARADAAHRHRVRGSCNRCAGCKQRFESIEEKVLHVMMGCHRQGAGNGRSKRVSRDAKVVGRQPY
jgi:hypothetical protein